MLRTATTAATARYRPAPATRCRPLSLFSRFTEGVSRVASELRHEHDTQSDLPPATLPLLSFHDEATCDRWLLKSDGDVGGRSEHALVVSLARATAVWSGATSKGVDPEAQSEVPKNDQGRKAERTGFCAMRTSVAEWAPRGWVLQDYHGLCVRLRPDGRKYVLNVRAETVLADSRTDDLYQVRRTRLELPDTRR